MFDLKEFKLRAVDKWVAKVGYMTDGQREQILKIIDEVFLEIMQEVGTNALREAAKKQGSVAFPTPADLHKPDPTLHKL